jgi:6-phospho-beta-glucosidase
MSANGVKIAVIGGGSSYTPELIEGFIERHSELPVKEIYLVDVESGRDKLEIIGSLAKRMIEKAGVNIRIELTLNRAEGIKDADFVITQFRVGGLEARIRDEKIPLQYDVIGQETTGPGGFAKAQRTIPVMMDICKDMERLAPDSWLINFTNPAGIVTEAVLKYTNVKAIGLCNVPMGMISGAAKILGVEMKQVYIDFVGLNHLVWGSRIFLEGIDITDRFISELQKGKSMSMKNIQDLEWDQELLRSLGMFPCPYHRYYYMPDEMLKREKEEAALSGTRGERVKAAEKELFALYSDAALDIKPPQLAQRGGAHYSDAACSLISSIYNDKKDIQVVNVRNNGTIKELPEDAVIERNCVIDRNGAHPINVGHVPLTIRGLMQIVKAYEELTIEAAVKGEPALALQALLVHPLVPSIDAAKKLWKDILEQNKAFLPQFE